MQNILERELTEKNRQSGLMRQYFDGKRAAFDARQEKFLRMYPYHAHHVEPIFADSQAVLRWPMIFSEMQLCRLMKQSAVIGILHMY